MMSFKCFNLCKVLIHYLARKDKFKCILSGITMSRVTKKGVKYKNTSQAMCANKIMFLRKGPGCELIGAAC